MNGFRLVCFFAAFTACFFCHTSICQTFMPSQIPELEEKLKAATDPSAKAALCNDIGSAHSKNNYDQSLKYAKMALDFADEAQNKAERVRALVLFSTVYKEQRKLDDAEKYGQDALTLSRKINDRKGEVNSLKALGNAASARSNIPLSIQYGMEALEISRKISDKATEGSLLLNLGNNYGALGDLLKAREFYRKSLEIKESLGDEKSLANVLKLLGANYTKLADDLAEAERLLKRALEIHVKYENIDGQANTLNDLGNLFFIKRAYQPALEYFKKALSLVESGQNKTQILVGYASIANVLVLLGDYVNALDYNYKALNLANSINDKSRLAIIYLVFTHIKGAQGLWDETLVHADSSYQFAKNSGDKVQMAESLSSKGNALLNLGRLPEALEALTASEQILSKMSSSSAYIACLIEKGDVLSNLNRFDESEAVLQKALALGKKVIGSDVASSAYERLAKMHLRKAENELGIARKAAQDALNSASTGSVESQMYARKKLEEINRLLGQKEQAQQENEKIAAERDTLWNQEKIRNVTTQELNAQFEREKALDLIEQSKKDMTQKAEITKRNAQITELGITSLFLVLLSALGYLFLRNRQKHQKTALEKQAAEGELKALRAQLNPHFIFNSLNSIGHYIDTKDTGNARSYLANFAALMRNTLEQSPKKQISLEEETANLRQYLQLEAMRFPQPFEWKIDIAPELDAFDTQIPSMMVQPFVENAIWHGLMPKKESGKIAIQFNKSDAGLRCSVVDNGVGRPASDPEKEENSYQVHAMAILKDRFALLQQQTAKKSTFEFKDLKNPDGSPAGTQVDLIFPM